MKLRADRVRLSLLAVLILLALVDVAHGRRVHWTPETGDLVFHRSRSAQSAAVALATGSAYTHVGLVVMRDGEPFVLEAAATVRLTPLAAFRARGEGGELVVRRLRDRDARLDGAAVRRLVREGRAMLGRPYDVRFAWSDDAIYCSELVHKVYARGAGVYLGSVRRAGDFALGSDAVQRLIVRRFGRGRPFDPDEPVIAPSDLLADPQLEAIAVP